MAPRLGVFFEPHQGENLTMKVRIDGFTLIELLVTIAIIGVLFGMVAMALRAPANVVAATDLKAFVVTARSEAIKRNRAVAITFDAVPGTFVLSANNSGVATSCGANTTVVKVLDLNDGNAGVTIGVTFGGGGLVWLPNGLLRACAPSTPATMEATLTHRGRVSIVDVEATGRVEVR